MVRDDGTHVCGSPHGTVKEAVGRVRMGVCCSESRAEETPELDRKEVLAKGGVGTLGWEIRPKSTKVWPIGL